MKTTRIISSFIFFIIFVLFAIVPTESFSQKQKPKTTKQSTIQNKVQDLKNDPKAKTLDQNISIYAENESLSEVVERICNYLHLDYSYNSDLLSGKLLLSLLNSSGFMLLLLRYGGLVTTTSYFRERLRQIFIADKSFCLYP